MCSLEGSRIPIGEQYAEFCSRTCVCGFTKEEGSRYPGRFLLGYHDASLLVGVSGSASFGGGTTLSGIRSVLYRTPEQGYWITVIFNYEHGLRETRTRHGYAKSLVDENIEEPTEDRQRFNGGYPSIVILHAFLPQAGGLY